MSTIISRTMECDMCGEYYRQGEKHVCNYIPMATTEEGDILVGCKAIEDYFHEDYGM